MSNCFHCRFSKVKMLEPDRIRCHANPPQLVMVQLPATSGSAHGLVEKPVALWPIVEASDWCGKFEPYEKPK